MPVSAKFWDWIAERYSRTPVRDEESYQKKLQKTREYLKPDTEVFEFGCGTGSTAISHAPYVKRISAIDVSAKMIEIAQAKARAKNIANVSFTVGAIEDYAVAKEGFDVVMAHSILHLLKDKDQAINKARALLKPGGIFVSSTICMGDSFKTKAIAIAVSLVSYTGWLPYINIFSAEQLVESIKKAGFTIEHRWQPGGKAVLFLIARKI